MLFKPSQLQEIPTTPGIYAWYVVPQLSDFDLNKISKTVKELHLHDRPQVLREFFYSKIFKFFQKRSLSVEISGKLEAHFKGTVHHCIETSDSLIQFYSEHPEELMKLKNLFNQIDPFVLAPVYIGKSKNIRNRIEQHLLKIDELYEGQISNINYLQKERYEDEESYFAYQIFSRGISKEWLRISVKDISSSDQFIYIFENILNRINFPNFGSN